MNRELKFRVFNHGIKTMYNVWGFNQRRIQWAKEDGSLGGEFSFGKANKKAFTLMQYTGFKINEQDAYEGDIVSDGENNFVIEFRNGSFGVFDGKSMTVYSTSWKIIGNIYENSNLLK